MPFGVNFDFRVLSLAGLDSLTPFPATDPRNALVSPLAATHTKSPPASPFPATHTENRGVGVNMVNQFQIAKLRRGSE